MPIARIFLLKRRRRECCAHLAPRNQAPSTKHPAPHKTDSCENQRMAEDEKPRSALEIAMERLKQRDADSGVVDQLPTDEQKAAIGEARSVHAAKTAELQILQRSKMAGVFDPADRQRLEAEYRDELRRLNDDLVRKLDRIRGASGG